MTATDRPTPRSVLSWEREARASQERSLARRAVTDRRRRETLHLAGSLVLAFVLVVVFLWFLGVLEVLAG